VGFHGQKSRTNRFTERDARREYDPEKENSPLSSKYFPQGKLYVKLSALQFFNPQFYQRNKIWLSPHL
jgi:hypothetical protein